MAFPPTAYGRIVSDVAAQIRRDVNNDEPHGTVGLYAIREVTLTGQLFNGWARHRRLALQW